MLADLKADSEGWELERRHVENKGYDSYCTFQILNEWASKADTPSWASRVGNVSISSILGTYRIDVALLYECKAF